MHTKQNSNIANDGANLPIRTQRQWQQVMTSSWKLVLCPGALETEASDYMMCCLRIVGSQAPICSVCVCVFDNISYGVLGNLPRSIWGGQQT